MDEEPWRRLDREDEERRRRDEDDLHTRQLNADMDYMWGGGPGESVFKRWGDLLRGHRPPNSPY